MDDNQAGSIFEQRVQTSHIHISQITSAAIFTHILRQIECSRIALLLGNKLSNLRYLRRIDKGTLHTYRICPLQEQHITTPDQLISSGTVENSTRVNHGRYTESDTSREVRLDCTGNDIRCRTLRSDDHVDTHRTRQLGDTGNRQLYLFTRRHNQVAELVNHHHNVRHKLMSLFRIQLTINKLLIILLNIAHVRGFQ